MKKRIYLLYLVLLSFFPSAFSVTLQLSKSQYYPNEDIQITFDGSENKKDWLGLYEATKSPGTAAPSMEWYYLNGTQQAPSVVIPTGAIHFQAPSKPGDYTFYFCENDGYTVLSSIDVKVVSPSVNVVFNANLTTIKKGDGVAFKNYTPESDSCLWTFEGGLPAVSKSANPTVTYSQTGSFKVSLTVFSNNNSYDLVKDSYITVAENGTPTDVKLMQFNIWQEGKNIPSGELSLVNIINLTNPDIISLSETSANTTNSIVTKLKEIGLEYFYKHISGNDVSVLSKYPFVDGGKLIGGRINVHEINVHGRSIIVAGAHLDYTHYACYLPRGYKCGGYAPYDGWDKIGAETNPKPVLDSATIAKQNLAGLRDEQLAAFLKEVEKRDIPIFLLGDFNEPSHLDWTKRQADMFDHHGVTFQWPTSLTLEKNNYQDAFRAVYRDEVENPGITWPSKVTNSSKQVCWAPLSDERDRIDYIFYKGSEVAAKSCFIVGPKESFKKGSLSLENTESDHFLADSLTWPSDHKALLANITIPAGSPVYVPKTTIRNDLYEVFPNPCTNSVTIRACRTGKTTLSLLNLSGEVVYTSTKSFVKGEDCTIDVSNQPSTALLLKIDDGNSTTTYKILKQ